MKILTKKLKCHGELSLVRKSTTFTRIKLVDGNGCFVPLKDLESKSNQEIVLLTSTLPQIIQFLQSVEKADLCG